MAYSEGYEAAQKEFNSPAAKVLNKRYISDTARKLHRSGVELSQPGKVAVDKKVMRFGKGLGKLEAKGKGNVAKNLEDLYDHGIGYRKMHDRQLVNDNLPIDKLKLRQETKKLWGDKKPDLFRRILKDDMKMK